MTDARLLWDNLFPMVFHVDYWNYLGWRDPYSSSAHSQRQREYKNQAHINAVYTPGFVVNGKEWRGWFRTRGIPASQFLHGNLNVSMTSDTLEATYEHFKQEQMLNIAILGFDLRDHILAGENRDLTLAQNFVVLSHQKFKPTDNSTGSEAVHWQVPWYEPNIKAPRIAAIIWVDTANDYTPIQITGGWLPELTTRPLYNR